MNSRCGHLSNLWFYADTETPSREDNPSQTGSSVDRGEFRPIIKDFSFPLISLGHFYVFFFFPLSLQPWAADLHTLAGRRGGLERRCPLPLHFLPFSYSVPCRPLSLPLHLSHSGDLELPFLTSNKTLLTRETVALCQDTHSYGCLKCISNTRGVSQSFIPEGLLIRAHLCCTVL